MANLKNEIQYIKGVGPRRAAALTRDGINTVKDLLLNFPKSYIDRTKIFTLKTLKNNLLEEKNAFDNLDYKTIKVRSEASIVAKIIAITELQISKSRYLLKLIISDGSGVNGNVLFWNQINYFKKIYQPDLYISISGKPELDKFHNVTFNHPEIEIILPEDIQLYSSGSILPKYRLTEQMKKTGLNMRLMRRIVESVIEQEIELIEETLPNYILIKLNLPEIKYCIRNLHFPSSAENIELARKRIKFEEIFYYELYLAINQKETKNNEKGPIINQKSHSARRLFDSLPFQLTGDQKKVLREIYNDLKSGSPMNRLIQGDVGSGKTIVGLLAMLMVVDYGYQVAMMAPTEILAEQHYNTLSKFLKDFELTIVQLIGGQNAKQRREVFESISNGEANIIIGTHAMFESNVEYNNLGLLIIDEQHRFGVAQRAELKRLASKSLSQKGLTPHILVLSATPIPRTLSMTIYGDLDVSTIYEMPKYRKPIKTFVRFESNLPEVYNFMKRELNKGRQAFIVYPLVEESEKMNLKAATVHYEEIKKNIFPEFKCGLIHGQMFWYEKDDIMQAFLEKNYDILVATTVIEVGIDIPNATVMLIENAERFGLAQLHQLRGRVGRGTEQSYCILITKDNFQYHFKNTYNSNFERIDAIIRLKTMEKTNNGFEIAEIDLKLRGPGDILGTKQSGLPEFKYLDLVADIDLISIARNQAYSIINNDPKLTRPENQILKMEYLKKFSNEKSFIDIA